MSSNYSEIASKLNSAADTIESNITTISNRKSSFDSIWSGSAHDNLIGNLKTSVNNAKTQVSNLRKMAGCLNNLQSYKDKKGLRYDIEALDKDLTTLRSRINGSIGSFSRVSKNFSIINFEMTEEKEKAKEEQRALQASQAKVSSSNQTMIKDSYSNPDFGNLDAWVYKNPYAQAGYTGQCTWFSWGKFYETYGYSPGFTGDGCNCVDQLIRAHGDKFYKSDTPVAGSVFSVLARSGHPHGHTGMIIAVNGDTITVQDGNYNGTSDSFAVAQRDWGTYQINLNEWKSRYSNGVVFANPI